MNKRIKKIILFLGILFVFLLKAGFVWALEVQYPNILGQSLNDTSSLGDFVCYLFNFITSLAVSISVIIIAYGGINYLVSYGRGKFTDEGKEWVKAGILGLLLTLSVSLIAYTINPTLTSCRIGILPMINLSNPSLATVAPPPGADTIPYQEIPIGTLTENLLTRTIDCYGFDLEGNPIDGDKLSTGEVGPTFQDHDRADCLTQLVDGSQKKGQIIASLANKISDLTDTCSCQKYGNCDPTCGGQCDQPTTCPAPEGTKGSCSGACVGGSCQQGSGPSDCCPAGVKDKIENGPIEVSIDFKQSGEASPSSTGGGAGNQIVGISNRNSKCDCGDGTYSADCCAGTCDCGDGTFLADCCTGGTGGLGSGNAGQTGDNLWSGGAGSTSADSAYGKNGSVAGGGEAGSAASANSASGSNGKGSLGWAKNSKYALKGQPCQIDIDCESKYCDPNGTCQLAPNGYPCEAMFLGDGCLSGYCDTKDNYICAEPPNGSNKLLGGKITNKDCLYDSDCQSTFCDPNPNSSGVVLTCQPAPNDHFCYNSSQCSCGYCSPNGLCCAGVAKSPTAAGGGAGGGGAGAAANGNNGSKGSCETPVGEYNGLDEFRCPNPANKDTPCTDIASYVERTTQADGKTVTLIDQAKWAKLNLIQQLTYFKEKIASWPKDSGIKDDEDVLDQARSALSSCYEAIPSVDLIKTYEQTDQTQHIVFIDPEKYTDPATKKPIDVSKYCTGFNYDNSSCLKKCDDACPDSSSQAIQLYKACGSCGEGDKECLAQQETCIEDAYDKRPCTYGTTSQTFGDCMTSCQNDCSDNCDKMYSSCSDEYGFCQSQCQNNGQCVLDNAGSCLFGAEGFQQCGQSTDLGNADYCIKNAYLCKDGSDQYAGYPDCVDPSHKTPDYSASFLSNNPDYQKCSNAYEPAAEGSYCYEKNTACQQVCPETAKCPTGSFCPDCQCDQINQPVGFSVPNVSVADHNTSASAEANGAGGTNGPNGESGANGESGSGGTGTGGIGSGGGSSGVQCDTDADCGSGYYCEAGECSPNGTTGTNENGTNGNAGSAGNNANSTEPWWQQNIDNYLNGTAPAGTTVIHKVTNSSSHSSSSGSGGTLTPPTGWQTDLYNFLNSPASGGTGGSGVGGSGGVSGSGTSKILNLLNNSTTGGQLDLGKAAESALKNNIQSIINKDTNPTEKKQLQNIFNNLYKYGGAGSYNYNSSPKYVAANFIGTATNSNIISTALYSSADDNKFLLADDSGAGTPDTGGSNTPWWQQNINDYLNGTAPEGTTLSTGAIPAGVGNLGGTTGGTGGGSSSGNGGSAGGSGTGGAGGTSGGTVTGSGNYNPGYDTQAIDISVFQMVGPQCDSYSFNDDPLTFYCQDTWWQGPNKIVSGTTPLGAERECSQSGEVPVGQTVDDAKNWANALVAVSSGANQDIQKMLDQMTKIGDAKNTSPIQDYCKCGARMEDSSAICKTGCQYSQQQIDQPVCEQAPDNTNNTDNGNGGNTTDTTGGSTDVSNGANGGSDLGPIEYNNTQKYTTANFVSTSATNSVFLDSIQTGGENKNPFSLVLASCISNSGCPADQHCSNGACVAGKQCLADDGCASGQVCINKICITGVRCPTHTCPGGQFCISGLCGNCYNDSDCTPDQHCDSNLCVIGAPTAGETGGTGEAGGTGEGQGNCGAGEVQTGTQKVWQCNCTFTPCTGGPCQQVTDYLSELWNDYRQFKIDFIGFYTAMLKDPRSDIMKELTYSRNQTSDCSLVNTAYGADAKLLDCTRVEDEQIPPINTGVMTLNDQEFPGYCYGTKLGENSAPYLSLTDNWFCCQEFQKKPTSSQ